MPVITSRWLSHPEPFVVKFHAIYKHLTSNLAYPAQFFQKTTSLHFFVLKKELSKANAISVHSEVYAKGFFSDTRLQQLILLWTCRTHLVSSEIFRLRGWSTPIEHWHAPETAIRHAWPGKLSHITTSTVTETCTTIGACSTCSVLPLPTELQTSGFSNHVFCTCKTLASPKLRCRARSEKIRMELRVWKSTKDLTKSVSCHWDFSTKK